VALPSTLDPSNRPNPTFGGGFGNPPPPNGQPQPQFGNFPPPQQPQFGGPAPHFGPPPQQQNPQLAPIGTVGGVHMNLPTAQPGAPQSQIETALSLPRPDPHALWLAQQEKQKGERRNTGVLIAIVALAALCVIGIGTLVYFKYFRAKKAAVTATADAATSATAEVSATATSTAPTVATTASETAAATVTASASASAAAQAPSAAAQAPAGKGGSKDPPGTLSITCKPFCDDILDNGKSIGPSPVSNLPVPAGQHRITLKKGKDTKVISVLVTSGQSSSSRVTM
jgi:serine/threonine-protein kinase